MSALVDAVEPGDLTDMLAEAWLSGDGQAWLMVAHVCASIHNSLLIAANRQGGKVEEKDFRDAEDYLPGFLRDRKPKPAKDSHVSLDGWMKSVAGF